MKIKLFMILVFLLLAPVVVVGQNSNRASNFVTIEHTFEDPDSGILLMSTYSFSLDFSEWKITDNKAIDMKVEVIESDAEVLLIEHMHADVFIESTAAAFDGVIQDSMDDKIHGGGVPGFYIDTNYSYYETFSIEGTNDQFTRTMLNMYCYNIGYGSGCDGEYQNFRISESELREEYGVYGNSLYFVYDLLIKYPGEDFYHKQIFTDTILVDLEKNSLEDNYGDRADSEATDETASLQLLSLLAIPAVVLLYRRKQN